MTLLTLRPMRLAALAVLAAASAACFTSETVIKLHPNGSGTIEQTNLVNSAMIGMASGMAKSAAGGGAQSRQVPSIDEIFSDDQLRKQADMFGTGVRFVSSERLSQNGMQGARAVYAFDKVESLSVGSSGRGNGDLPSGPAGPPMQFAQAPHGSGQRVTVTLPNPKEPPSASAAPATPPAPPQVPPEAFDMVKSMFAGARFSVDLEVDGRIVSTNAPASNGSRATLIAIDFGELLSDASKLQALQALRPGTDLATVRKTLEGMKGVKMPLEQTVTIDYAK